MITAVAAVATAITALIGLGIKIWVDSRKRAAQSRSDAEAYLAERIAAAKNDEERKKLAQELYDLRNRR